MRDYPSQLSDSQRVASLPLEKHFTPRFTVADLTKQLRQAFEEISLGANYPIPTFNGKKGENPEDHCMKAEDYFKVYKIVRDEDKRRHFTDTTLLNS